MLIGDSTGKDEHVLKLLAAASMATLPICTVNDEPVSAIDFAMLEGALEGNVGDDPFGKHNGSYLGAETGDWRNCVEGEIESMNSSRLQFTPDRIATAAVDACVIEADGYKKFVAKFLANPRSSEIDPSFERMRTKFIRYYSAIETSRRAGYKSPIGSNAEAPK